MIQDILPPICLAVLGIGWAYAILSMVRTEQRRAKRLRCFAKEQGLAMDGPRISGFLEGTSVTVEPSNILVRKSDDDLISCTTKVSIPIKAHNFWLCNRAMLPTLKKPLAQLKEAIVFPDYDFNRRFIARAEAPLEGLGWNVGWVRQKLMELGLEQAVCSGNVLIAQFGLPPLGRKWPNPPHVHAAVLATIGLSSAQRATALAPQGSLPLKREPPTPAGFWAFVPSVLLGAIGSSFNLFYEEDWKAFAVTGGIGYLFCLLVFSVIVEILKRRHLNPSPL